MKAMVQDAYGRAKDVLRSEDVDPPEAGEGQVVVRVCATGVNPLDWHLVRGTPFVGRAAMGWSRPKGRVRGAETAGVVTAVGDGVTAFKPGDEVFGFCEGGFAELVAGPEKDFALKPAGVTFEEAAGTPVAALTALQGLRDSGGLRAGQRVLVNGASGGVGIFAVQIAKSFGAGVTGVCSTRNVEMVRSLGADRVLDYTRDDFTKGQERYDLILDNAGNHPISAVRRVLSTGGVYVYNSGAAMRRVAWAMLLGRMGRNVRMFLAHPNQADLQVLRELMEAGKLRTVIDRKYPLAQTADALDYVEQGHARGKVLVVPD